MNNEQKNKMGISINAKEKARCDVIKTAIEYKLEEATVESDIKIAIIDKDFLDRISLKRVLSKIQNMSVVSEYASAEEFINSNNKNMPDIVLMNLDLGGMNGILATQKLKKEHPEIKVIIRTEHISKDFFRASAYAGACGYVVKKPDVKELTKIIKAVYFGALWFEDRLFKIYEKCFPKPNLNDLWHLYDEEPADYDLSVREMQVLYLLLEGDTNLEIALKLFITKETSKAHLSSIFRKMKVKNRIQAVVKALRSGIV